MTYNKLPPLDALLAELSYDPLTGNFKWLRSGKGRNSDLSIGHTLRMGYRRIHFRGKTYNAHRLAFYMHHRREPSCVVDHIDGDPLNNRISNLREATRQQNSRNRTARGYQRHPKRKKNPFQARIFVDGQWIGLGVFSTEAAAKAAYEAGKLKFFGEFCRRARG